MLLYETAGPLFTNELEYNICIVLLTVPRPSSLFIFDCNSQAHLFSGKIYVCKSVLLAIKVFHWNHARFGLIVQGIVFL